MASRRRRRRSTGGGGAGSDEPCHCVTVHPHPNCTEPCREDLQCRSADCRTEWDSCPPGTTQIGNMTRAADERGECYDTECTPGGCKDGFTQVGSGKSCFDPVRCAVHAGLCNREHCCPQRPSVRCCKLLKCNLTYAGCQVPQQTFLSDPSHSEIDQIEIRHGDSAPFPFYTAAQLPWGGSCDAVRVYGSCVCDDGRPVPGCEPGNSSTWYRRVDGPQGSNATADTSASAPRLAANLSLTCAVAPAPPPAPPSPAPPEPAAAAAAAAASATAAQGAGSPPPDGGAGGSNGNTSTGGGGGGGGGGRQGSHESRGASGSLVAMIVIGCLALAGVTAGVVLWCCGLLPDLHNLRIRSLTSYEPIFTGQPYTPSRSGGRYHPQPRSPAGAAEDIPWNRFCAAVTEAGRRILYGRRYLEESASAAAAAERYRTLNSLGRRRSDVAGGGGGGSDDGEPTAWAAGKPTRGSLVLSTFPSGRHKPHDDDLGVDEVFTLEDLGAGSSDTAGGAWRPVGPLPLSRAATASAAATAGGPQLPQSRRSSSGASAIAPSGPWWQPVSGATAAAELGERASRGPSAASAGAGGAASGASTSTLMGHPRPRLNQFGRSSAQAGADGGGGGGGDGDGADVIHTRPLALGDGDGGEEFEVPPDVDAPLRWLPSPQVTGQGPGAS